MEALQNIEQEQDDFGVQLRGLHPIGLAVDLVKLAVAPLLGPFVAEHGPQGVELLDPAALVQAVFQDRPQHRGGGLGAQGQGFALAVRKAVHLLADDVSVGPDGAGEELGAFQQGQTDLPVAIEGEDLPGHLLHPLPPGRFRGQQVPHAPNRLNHPPPL